MTTRSRDLRTTLPTNTDTQGARIRYARISAGLSQAQLAAGVGKACGTAIGKGLVSKWESDTVANPNNAHLFAIQALTGFSAQWLATNREPKRASSLAAKHGLDPEILHAAIVAVPVPWHDQRALATVLATLYDIKRDEPTVSQGVLGRTAKALQERDEPR